jgi:hypothetical protein
MPSAITAQSSSEIFCLSEKGDNLSHHRAADRAKDTIGCCPKEADSDFHIFFARVLHDPAILKTLMLLETTFLKHGRLKRPS